MFKKDDSVFDKINNYLTKKGHRMLLSLYLSNFNGNSIYVRFDYVGKISAYKVVWFDLGFFDEKKIGFYVNQQLVTNHSAMRIIDTMLAIKAEPGFKLGKDIIGDRVEILSYITENNREYVFDRFLPLEWKELIGPLVMLFSYLPREMESFLSEMFALFDGRENYYKVRKPIKFDLAKGNLRKLFTERTIDRAKKYVDGERVSYLEKVNNTYIGIVDGFGPEMIAIEELDKGFIHIKSNCKCNDFCKHICALIIAIREKKFNSFYKVRYVGTEDKTLLDKVTDSAFNLCFGIDGDKLMIISQDLVIHKIEAVVRGKSVFEIIEDDDECSLSKNINKIIKK